MTCGMATEFFDRFAYDRIIQDPGIVEYSRCAARRKATRMAVWLWRSSLIPDSASSSQLHKLKPLLQRETSGLARGIEERQRHDLGGDGLARGFHRQFHA